MPGGPITLTTDFGASDHFVGAMKGVILSIAPRAQIVDITHEIAPYGINEAAFVIAQAWSWFPKGTIHVIVIDPGVGSARRPILAEAGGQFFIAPDNGVLTMIYDSANSKVRVISNPKLMSKHISRTFHGRDVFAPAAAHLARGVPMARFGKIIDDYVRIQSLKPVALAPNKWTGAVLKVDHFGNLITNFRIEDFREIETRPFEIRVGVYGGPPGPRPASRPGKSKRDQEVARGSGDPPYGSPENGFARIHRLAPTFSDAALCELVAIVGSSGYVEIAANQASATQILGCGAGAMIELEIFYD